MKKTLQIECPNCGEVLSFAETDLPPDFANNVFAVDCPECSWSRIITFDEVQEALKNSKSPKGMFKAHWGDGPKK